MKAKPYREKEGGGGYVGCSAQEATHVMLHMEGPFPNRLLPVILRGSRDAHPRKPVWSWNGDTEKPILKPSMVVETSDRGKCHTWVTDGQAQYLGDCTHEFKGTTRPLLDVD